MTAATPGCRAGETAILSGDMILDCGPIGSGK